MKNVMRHVLSHAYVQGSLAEMEAQTMATPQQIRAQQRRDAADRARAYRERHRVSGTPLPREVDAALSEAIAFWLAREAPRLRDDGIEPSVAAIPLQELLKVARRILVQRGGADRTMTTEALGRRIAPRDEHTRSDFVPSLAPASS